MVQRPAAGGQRLGGLSQCPIRWWCVISRAGQLSELDRTGQVNSWRNGKEDTQMARGLFARLCVWSRRRGRRCRQFRRRYRRRAAETLAAGIN